MSNFQIGGETSTEVSLGKALETFNLFPSLAEIKKPIKKHTIDTVELTDDPKAAELWDVCLQLIKDNIGDQMFKTWFAPTKALRWHEDVLIISVPSQFFCEWIEEHYFTLLRKVVNQVLGSKARLQYQVVVDKGKNSLEDRAITLPALRNPPAPTSGQAALPFINTPQTVQHYPTYLNPRYIFDNFIRGDSNQLAVSAALAVSDAPGKTKFNPLCIYGGTGLGKTHLIQAIGNHIVQNNRNMRVFYTNSERFTIEYVNAIQNNKVNEFTNFYRSIDVLIVDDIQFFSGKEKTQDNFFHTFNALYQSGKQIILSSDKPPKELRGVDERLLSRFQWGLTVDIQPPDYETRLAIIQRKSADEGFEVSAPVAEYLARNIGSSVRELEGALISVLAKVSLDNREMSLQLAQEVVKGYSQAMPQQSLTIDDIKKAVASYFKFTLEALEGKTRKHEIVLARQVAMYLTKQMTQLSLKSIGANFGGRDHTTVLHSCEMIENYLKTDKTVQTAIEHLSKRFGY